MEMRKHYEKERKRFASVSSVHLKILPSVLLMTELLFRAPALIFSPQYFTFCLTFIHIFPFPFAPHSR